jgi:hypothetical protein
METISENKFYNFFKGLCLKRMCNYRTRSSRYSNYIEVDIGKRTYLFRFSNHPHAHRHDWVPDFDVLDRGTFKEAKKFLKYYCKPVV